MFSKKEASHRWCPFARVPLQGHTEWGTCNRTENGGIIQGSACLADQCMAWRWQTHPFVEVDETAVGYCGLAGHPGMGG